MVRNHRQRERHDARDEVGQRIAIQQTNRVLQGGAPEDDRRLADDGFDRAFLEQIDRAAGERAGVAAIIMTAWVRDAGGIDAFQCRMLFPPWLPCREAEGVGLRCA